MNIAFIGCGNVGAPLADHLQRFWDPRMRETLLTYAESGEAQLSPRVRDALKLLQ